MKGRVQKLILIGSISPAGLNRDIKDEDGNIKHYENFEEVFERKKL